MPKVSIGDAEIYYEAHGDGPPLLLVPGLGGGGSFWSKQVRALKDDFRVIVHDHRGAGQSTHSLIDYSVDQMADDTIRLMDALGIDSAHYVGHSTGGAMGQIIAEDHPERLKSLVLSATWPGKDAFFRRTFEMRREALTRLGLDSYGKASLLTLFPSWWISRHDAEMDAQQKLLAVNQPPIEVMLSRIDAIMAFDRRDRLADIHAPTLVICARDDNVCPFYLSQELAAGIGGAELVTLETGGHFAPLVMTDQYNDAVGGFLRRQIGA